MRRGDISLWTKESSPDTSKDVSFTKYHLQAEQLELSLQPQIPCKLWATEVHQNLKRAAKPIPVFSHGNLPYPALERFRKSSSSSSSSCAAASSEAFSTATSLRSWARFSLREREAYLMAKFSTLGVMRPASSTQRDSRSSLQESCKRRSLGSHTPQFHSSLKTPGVGYHGLGGVNE